MAEHVADAPTESNMVWYYDADGNIISNSQGTAYSYDYDNRLVSWRSGTESGAFAYNAAGHRTRRVSLGVTNYLILDYADALKRPLLETDVSGQPVRFYIWFSRGLVAQAESNGTIRWAHSDEQGSILALTDGAGSLTSQFAYSPYGQQYSHTGSDSTPFTWLGGYGVRYVADQLYLTIYRGYNAELAWFIQADPIGIAGGANIYLYGNANPLFYTDSVGLYAGLDDAAFALAGLILGLGGQAVSDLIAWDRSSYQTYAASMVGGAIGGWSSLYVTPVAGGAIGAAAKSVIQHSLDNVSEDQPFYKYDAYDAVGLAVDTSVGAVMGKAPKIPIRKLTSGQGSYSSITKGMVTKFKNNQISHVSTKTAGKMLVARTVGGITSKAGSSTYSGINRCLIK